MATLVICEKPSVAADVAGALGTLERFDKASWGYRSASWWVCAAAGHLVEMSPPERYGEQYKEWQFEDLPILPEPFQYQPRDERGAARLQEIAALINDSAVTGIVNACDAGREGELIFALIYQYARSHKPVQRAWFNSMTANAIIEAFNHLRVGTDLAGLEAAARCRSEADWVVGMNATRAASCTLGGKRFTLSLGRVQTPTLALIVRRDVEIESFIPSPYQQISAEFVLEDPTRRFTGWWRSGRSGEIVDRLEDPAAAAAIALAVKTAGIGTIDDVDVRNELVQAPRLFDLTSLQREMNKRHGLSAARTLAAAQVLYEELKYLTYPRTDSQYITTDMASGVPTLLGAVSRSMPELAAAAGVALQANLVQRIVNDAKVTDHHAIIVTDGTHDLSRCNDDQRKVYELVARRFVAALLEPQQLERTVAWVSVVCPERTEWFRAAGRRELAPGWRLAWPEATKTAKGGQEVDDDSVDSEDDGALCELTKGEQPQVRTATVAEKMTKAPARYNEASVLAAMETAGRFVDDDDAADAMKDRGLGTPATRAAILETLIQREYIERQGRALTGTDKGRGLILALGEHPLVLPDLTGEWEHRLRTIERLDATAAGAARTAFNTAVRAFTAEITQGFAAMTPDLLRAGRRTFGACPLPACTGSIVQGPRGWGCSSWKSKEDTGCGFVFWKEQSGKKMTEKHLAEYVANLRSGKVTFAARGERIVIGACPRCGTDVVERAKGWGCTSWKSPKETGCGYAIWRNNPDGTELDRDAATAMLAAGATNQRERVVLCPCPRCGGNIVDRGKFYGCDSWKSARQKGCGITAWKQSKGAALDPEEILADIARQGAEGPAPKPTKRSPKRK